MKPVTIIGMGGLGAPIASTLADAHRADAPLRLRIVDDDVVELSNLQRQVIFGMPDIGLPKVEAAAAKLRARGVEVDTLQARLHPENADTILADSCLVIDGTDDPRARFIINDWGIRHGIPAVIGGVHRFRGMVFAHAGHGPCLRCIFEDDGPEVETCAAAGVIGAMPGLVGHLQAERALAILAGRRTEATGYITTLEARQAQIRDIPIDAHCPTCTPAPDTEP